MNIIDIIILCCLVPAIIRGISKGFIDQAYSLVALVLGAWLSFKFSGAVGNWLSSFAELPASILHLVAFALILLVVMALTTIAGKAVEGLVKVVMLGWLNKLLGAVFAVLKALLVIGLVVIMIDSLNSLIPIIPAKTLEGSVLYQPVKDIANVVFPYLKELIFKK